LEDPFVKIFIWVLVTILVLAAAGSIYLAYHINDSKNREIERITEEKDREIFILTEIVDSIGEVVEVYALRTDVKHGWEVDHEHFERVEIPLSLYTPEYILMLPDFNKSFYKINLSAGTPLTYSLLMSELITNQDRYFELVAHMFPIGLAEGDFIDYRIVTPNGQDFIIFSKKRVYSFNGNTITLILNQEEIHRYQSALLDVVWNSPSILYCVKYVEPGFQAPASVYYPVNNFVLAAMEADPNIISVVEKDIINQRREALVDGAALPGLEVGAAVEAWRTTIISKILEDNQRYAEYLQELAEREAQAGDSVDYDGVLPD
jgi:hypothetical protein